MIESAIKTIRILHDQDPYTALDGIADLSRALHRTVKRQVNERTETGYFLKSDQERLLNYLKVNRATHKTLLANYDLMNYWDDAVGSARALEALIQNVYFYEDFARIFLNVLLIWKTYQDISEVTTTEIGDEDDEIAAEDSAHDGA